MAKKEKRPLVIMATYMRQEIISQLANYNKSKIYDVYYIEIPNRHEDEENEILEDLSVVFNSQFLSKIEVEGDLDAKTLK